MLKTSAEPSCPLANKKILAVIIITALAAIIIFISFGLWFWYNQLPENNPQRSKADCEKAGGEWAEEQSLCLISNRLAGEECTDGGQCRSGVCFPPDLSEKQMEIIYRGEKITGLTGACYPDDLAFGCVKQVIKGTVSLESLCLD